MQSATPDVQLRFLCPDDLEEVIIFTCAYLDTVNLKEFQFSTGSHSVPGLVPHRLPAELVHRHHVEHTILCAGRRLPVDDYRFDCGRNQAVRSPEQGGQGYSGRIAIEQGIESGLHSVAGRSQEPPARRHWIAAVGRVDQSSDDERTGVGEGDLFACADDQQGGHNVLRA